MTDGFSFGRILPVNVWVVFFCFLGTLRRKYFVFLHLRNQQTTRKSFGQSLGIFTIIMLRILVIAHVFDFKVRKAPFPRNAFVIFKPGRLALKSIGAVIVKFNNDSVIIFQDGLKNRFDERKGNFILSWSQIAVRLIVYFALHFWLKKRAVLDSLCAEWVDFLAVKSSGWVHWLWSWLKLSICVVLILSLH